MNCHYFNDADDFCVSIDTRNPKDEIFFVMSGKIKTVDEVVDIVMKECEKGKSEKLTKHDSFQMPVINFDISRSIK